jgi:inositol-phosphate phosphatase/L-galactose 1-phosphate phosphatase/histidinol-phosphatase
MAFAEELADRVRPIAMQYFRGTFDTAIKGDGSPVTVADRSIEQLMRDHIGACYPNHGIYGEEFGADVKASTWVIDPIDGTKSFVTGMPLFGTLIALAEDGAPVLGVIDIPALDERWTGSNEGSCFNGAPAHTSSQATLAGAKLYTTSPDSFTDEGFVIYERLSRSVAMRRFGGDCYAYGLLASGHCDLVVEEGLKPFDYMALVPIIEGAGGVVSDWQGRPLGLGSNGQIVAAATKRLHDETLAVMQVS